MHKPIESLLLLVYNGIRDTNIQGGQNMIETYLLEQFAAFARCGTLLKASEELHITQPTLSVARQIVISTNSIFGEAKTTE